MLWSWVRAPRWATALLSRLTSTSQSYSFSNASLHQTFDRNPFIKRSMGLQQQPAYAPQADIGTYSRRLGKSDTDAQERCPTAMPCHLRALCIKPMDHHDGFFLLYARLSELTRECARSSSSAFFGFPSSGQTRFVLSDSPDVWMRLWRHAIACRQPACVCIACC